MPPNIVAPKIGTFTLHSSFCPFSSQNYVHVIVHVVSRAVHTHTHTHTHTLTKINVLRNVLAYVTDKK